MFYFASKKAFLSFNYFSLDDYNRVILKKENGSDFINASYIHNQSGKLKFIAAQGKKCN